MEQRYRILSFDGASKTGGAGWVSIGMLRDLWFRNLGISRDLFKWIRVIGSEGRGEDIRFIQRYFLFLAKRSDQKFPAPIETFGQGRVSSIKWMDWLSEVRGALGGWPSTMGPLPEELAVIAFGQKLRHGTGQSMEADLSAIRQTLRGEPIRWRFRSADHKDHDPGGLEIVRAALEDTPSKVGEWLAVNPTKFLGWWWTFGQDHVDGVQREIEEARRRFDRFLELGLFYPNEIGKLDNLDLLSGTSSGGLNALVFAQYDQLKPAMEEAFSLWLDLGAALREANESGLTRKMMALAGKTSFFEEATKPVIEKYFRDKTLSELNRKVAVTAVQLDSGTLQIAEPLRRWKTVVYHNLDLEDWDDDLNLDDDLLGIRCVPHKKMSRMPPIKLSELARYTSSIPILASIPTGENLFKDHEFSQGDVEESGFIDGGFFANNPSLAAVSLALQFGKSRGEDLLARQIAVLSLGNSRRGQDHIELADRDLGYGPWLFHRERPGLLVDMTLDLGIDAVNGYCKAVLGKRYKRWNSWCDFGMIQLNPQTPAEMERALEQALGASRYVFRLNLNDWFRAHWTP